MKKIIILTFLCFLFFIHNAQTVYSVSTPTILSQNASDVKVITKVSFGNSAMLINHAVSVDNVNKKVNLVSCYYYNPILPSAPVLISTVNIGALSTGNYDLNYTVFITYNSTTVCATPNDTTDNTYTFYAGPNTIHEFSNDNEFKISPNPSKDFIKITSSNKPTIKKAEIVNILGDKVLEINDLTLNTNIDISSMPKGIYLLRINTDKNYFIKKIIKE